MRNRSMRFVVTPVSGLSNSVPCAREQHPKSLISAFLPRAWHVVKMFRQGYVPDIADVFVPEE